MSCEECDQIQDKAFDKNIPETVPIVYVRVGNSNMAIVGCQKHCKEIIDKLRGEDLTERDKKVVEIVEDCRVWRNTFITKKELIKKLEEAFPEK